MKDFLKNFLSAKLSTYATIIVIFTYNVLLEKDVECTCKPQTAECNLYMILPFFIIFLLTLWMDKKFQRTWKHTCTCRRTYPWTCRFFLVLVLHILRAVLVALLWVVSVLIDGDWYVCCQNDQSEHQEQLACKDKKNITAEEQTIIGGLKNHSKVIGFSLLLCIVVATLMSLFGWRKCCEGNSWCCSDRTFLYHKLVMEEEEIVLEEILRKAAKEKLTETFINKIGERKWEEIFDVAEEVMKESPTLSKKQQRQWEERKRKKYETPGATAKATPGARTGATTRATAATKDIELQSMETEEAGCSSGDTEALVKPYRHPRI